MLNSVSKVLEQAVFLQMIGYFESNKLLHPSHHGFRAGHSTTSALNEMIDKWADAFDKGQESAVITLDICL